MSEIMRLLRLRPQSARRLRDMMRQQQSRRGPSADANSRLHAAANQPAAQRQGLHTARPAGTPSKLLDRMLGESRARVPPRPWASAHWGNTLHQLPTAQIQQAFFGGFDVREGEDGGHVITADVPGLSKDDVRIEVAEGKFLTIRGSNAPGADGADGTDGTDANTNTSCGGGARPQHLQRSIDQTIRLPRTADVPEISAKVEHGVVTITVPRRSSADPVAISVN